MLLLDTRSAVVSPVAGVPGPRLFVPVIFTHLDSGEVSTPTAGTASQIPGQV